MCGSSEFPRLMHIGGFAVLCAASALSAQSPSRTAVAVADSARREIDAAVANGDVLRLEGALSLVENALAVFPGDPWLEHYVGFAHFRLSNVARAEGEESKARSHLERAEPVLQRSAGRMPLAETWALLAAVRGQRITGLISAMRLGRSSDAALERAMELGPRNPRVWATRASSMLFRPKLFGGSAEKAEEYARRAIALVATDSVVAPGPRWGESDAYIFLGQALAAQKKYTEARAAFERVLVLEPGNGYVREKLESINRMID